MPASDSCVVFDGICLVYRNGFGCISWPATCSMRAKASCYVSTTWESFDTAPDSLGHAVMASTAAQYVLVAIPAAFLSE